MLVSTFYDDIYGSKDSPYAEQYTYCYEREGEENFRARNTIHFFSTPILDYMVVALDYGAGDDILNWASEIIKQYPNHNVIVTTHGYLQADGTTLDRGESVYPSRDFGTSNSHGVNNGNEMWDKFVSQHKNIVLLLCGHMSSDKIVMNQRKGVNGNMVTEMLIDPQAMDEGDPKGMVANFFVSNGGSEITVNYYSTVKNIYYLQENNYTFNVNVIPRKDPNVVIFNSNGGSGSMQKVETGLVKFAIPECTFTAPTKNHIFKGWSTSKNGALITDKNILLKGTTTLYAIWERVELPTYVISVVGGTCSITDGKCEVGSIVTAKANEPTDGKVFKGWHGANGLTFISGNASSTEITFEMPNNSLTLIAMFEEPQSATFKIHASVIGNGQISSKGYTIVDNGASKTYTITPAQGFKIKDVKVNGVSVGAVESYTFSSVSQDNFIVAEFEKITESDSGNNTPDTPPTINNNSSGGLPIGAIIGIIAGAVIILGGAVVVIILKVKKK